MQQKNKPYFWILMALVCVCLPSIGTILFQFTTSSITNILGKSALVCYNIALVLLLPSVFKINLRTYFMCFLPLVFFAPLALAYYFIYNEMPAQWIVMALLDTNYQEIKELFGANKWGAVAFLINIMAYIFIIYYKLPKKIYLQQKKLTWCIIGFVVMYSLKIIVVPNKNFGDTIAETYPCGAIKNMALGLNQYIKIGQQTRIARSKNFGARQLPPRSAPELYVLIVGESARYDYWQINGYAQNTSPRLATRQAQGSLIAFGDVATQASTTFTSHPMILTNAQPQNFDSVYYYKTFMSAFAEANFETYWVFNDLMATKAPASALNFADEVAHVISAENILSTQQNYDGAMLPIIDSVMGIKNQPKKLLVIFTSGSHSEYALRYPAGFDFFQPSDFGQNRAFNEKNAVFKRNSYKNTILYTDFFVDEIIKKIEKNATIATVIYTADHGENLRDDPRNLILHGADTPYDLHIPLFIWQSKLYMAAHADTHKNLMNNKNKSANTHQIFYTLLDIAGIEYVGFDAQKSLANANYKPNMQRNVLKSNGKIMRYEEAR